MCWLDTNVSEDRLSSIHPEDGSITILRKLCIHPPHYTVNNPENLYIYLKVYLGLHIVLIYVKSIILGNDSQKVIPTAVSS